MGSLEISKHILSSQTMTHTFRIRFKRAGAARDPQLLFRSGAKKPGRFKYVGGTSVRGQCIQSCRCGSRGSFILQEILTSATVNVTQIRRLRREPYPKPSNDRHGTCVQTSSVSLEHTPDNQSFPSCAFAGRQTSQPSWFLPVQKPRASQILRPKFSCVNPRIEVTAPGSKSASFVLRLAVCSD